MAKKAIGMHRLSVREVQAAGAGKHDDGAGLQLRVGANGRAQWVYRFTNAAGTRREMGLGAATRDNPKQTGASLTAARDAADEARKLLRGGVDPLDARDRARGAARLAELTAKAEKQRERWTLARCARDYHERVIEPSRTPKHAAQWISSLENHVPAALWHRPIDEIKAPELLAALVNVKPHEAARRHTGDSVPETVRRIRQRLESIFEDAQFHERCASNPATAIRRKMREAAPKREARGSFAALPYREAPALMARLREAPGTAARCLEFAVLCAARTGEVLGATWDEIDAQAGVWCVPGARMKGGEAHTVYLSARALEILAGQRGQDSRYVFPSPATTAGGEARPLSNMAMLTTLGRLGVRDATTVHGLCRQTFSTWANELDIARPDVIEAALAHREADRIRGAYNKATFAEERRELLRKWADYLQGAQIIAFPVKAAS
jgi:integrase